MSSGELSFHRRWSGNEETLPTDFRWNGRPLVVIDPEDREQVERLVYAISELHVEQAQAALREFANPKPPKPEEPTGLGAVVEDVASNRWVRVHDADKAWRLDGYTFRDWDAVVAVRVLSEGVTS